MWQKAHPIGLRVGVIKSRASERHAKDKKQNASFLVEDIKLREFIDKFYPRSSISKVVIRKTAKEGEVVIFASKVGLIMGKDGGKIKEFEDIISKKFNKSFKVSIKAVKIPELSAKIMAEHIATQLEARMPFRKVAKQVLAQVMEKGAIGVKVKIGGRLWGVDIARRETFNQWRVPLQTLRADIDYCYTVAATKYGAHWIKVWIAKWEVFTKKSKQSSIKELIDRVDGEHESDSE